MKHWMLLHWLAVKASSGERLGAITGGGEEAFT